MKLTKLTVFLVVLAILSIRIFTVIVGPLDTYPRVQQTIVSPDGDWKLEVLRRKMAAFSPLADTETVFRVTDLKSGRVSDQRIERTKS
jgi:hypothetical protein